jgi:large subunit ribosomal protein L17
MRHGNVNRKFGRKRNQRKALMKALAVALVTKEKIQTTEPKAKELRPHAERLVSYAKKGTLAAHRDLVALVGGSPAKKLMTDIGPRYKDRKGGYTRITKLGFRLKDGSPQAQIEFV